VARSLDLASRTDQLAEGTSTPAVSVVLPVRDGGAYLANSVASIAR